MAVVQKREEIRSDASSPSIHGFDALELYVGNAYQASRFYASTFGFTPIAQRGVVTGDRESASVVLAQGNIRVVLTCAFSAASPIALHVQHHGDSVRDVAFAVDDAGAAVEWAVQHGAQPIAGAAADEDMQGRVVRRAIAGPGDLIHSFVERHDGGVLHDPGYQAVSAMPASGSALVALDHVAISVEPGQVNRWADFYCQVLGFEICHHEDIATTRSAMSSTAVRSPNGAITIVLLEAADGRGRSQIQEFITFNHGPGVQHAALLTHDIIGTVRAWRANGVEFLRIPDTYYDALLDRVGAIDYDLAVLRELGILIDRDENGTLMQVFTRPIQDRPTFFMEIVQRNGSRGFGGGNIRALFEAVEREQAARGSL
jgi:4-hydroxyphenylpyruvate dioxygenase